MLLDQLFGRQSRDILHQESRKGEQRHHVTS